MLAIAIGPSALPLLLPIYFQGDKRVDGHGDVRQNGCSWENDEAVSAMSLSFTYFFFALQLHIAIVYDKNRMAFLSSFLWHENEHNIQCPSQIDIYLCGIKSYGKFDSTFWGTVSEEHREGRKEILQYFQFFANIPGLSILPGRVDAGEVTPTTIRVSSRFLTRYFASYCGSGSFRSSVRLLNAHTDNPVAISSGYYTFQ